MKRLYNYHFPIPSYLAMKSCAIDISDQSIKYGELINSSSGLRLGKYGKEKIPSGIVVSGKIEKEDELVRILKKIKDKENLNLIRVSLPEEQTYLFTLSIPKINNENLRDLILLQIEEHIPLKALDSVFDYHIIRDDNQNLLVEVVAISSIILDGYLSVFNKAELIPLSFEIEAQAIARAVVLSGDTSPVMIVDFGDARTGVSISSNGRVLLTTTLSIGGADLTNMIAKNFSLSFDEAEKMKHEYGLDKMSKAEDIFPAILNGISVLRDELNKQYTYWETHNNSNTKNNQINHIILCGGDANLAGLSDYLELSMKIKVENANVWVNILKTDDRVPEMSFEESLSYATVLGLALGDYIDIGGIEPIINILPLKEKSIIKKEYWMRFFTILFNFIAIMGVSSAILLFPLYYHSQSKEHLVESKLEAFNKENPEFTDSSINKTIDDINSQLPVLDKAEITKINNNLLNDILASRTNGVIFSNIAFNKTMTTETVKVADKEEKKIISSSLFEIHGIANDRDSLRSFKTILDNNPNFKEVNLPISGFLSKKDLDFVISITMK